MKTYRITYKSKVCIGRTEPSLYYDYLNSIMQCYNPTRHDFLSWDLLGRVYRNLFMGSIEDDYFNVESTIIKVSHFIPEPVMYDVFRHLRTLDFIYMCEVIRYNNNIIKKPNPSFLITKKDYTDYIWFIDRLIENTKIEYKTYDI